LGARTGGPQQDDEDQAMDVHEGRLVKLYWTQRIADCNPDDPMHWLNRRANAGRMARIISRHEDNPSITPDYLQNLSDLTGPRRKRLYLGEWSMSEGAVFQEFDSDNHIVDPFIVPPEWPRFVGIDPGYDHPCAVLMVAVSPPPLERLYVIAESYMSNQPLEYHARKIIEMTEGHNVWAYYADPRHAFSKTAQSLQTIAQQLGRLTGKVWQKWVATEAKDAMVERLRQTMVDSRFRIFRTCGSTITELRSWRYKRNTRGESLSGDDQYEDKNNHSIDVLCGLVSSPLGWRKPAVPKVSSPRFSPPKRPSV
jgi:phage terminase large subunit